MFTFDRPPEIHANADSLNCSIAFNSSSRHEARKFRYLIPFQIFEKFQ
jgi:hypothetical protein